MILCKLSQWTIFDLRAQHSNTRREMIMSKKKKKYDWKLPDLMMNLTESFGQEKISYEWQKSVSLQNTPGKCFCVGSKARAFCHLKNLHVLPFICPPQEQSNNNCSCPPASRITGRFSRTERNDFPSGSSDRRVAVYSPRNLLAHADYRIKCYGFQPQFVHL